MWDLLLDNDAQQTVNPKSVQEDGTFTLATSYLESAEQVLPLSAKLSQSECMYMCMHIHIHKARA